MRKVWLICKIGGKAEAFNIDEEEVKNYIFSLSLKGYEEFEVAKSTLIVSKIFNLYLLNEKIFVVAKTKEEARNFYWEYEGKFFVTLNTINDIPVRDISLETIVEFEEEEVYKKMTWRELFEDLKYIYMEPEYVCHITDVEFDTSHL